MARRPGNTSDPGKSRSRLTGAAAVEPPAAGTDATTPPGPPPPRRRSQHPTNPDCRGWSTCSTGRSRKFPMSATPSGLSASPRPRRWSSSSSNSSAASSRTTARCSACSSCPASWSSSCSCSSCSPGSRTGTSDSCNCPPRSWRGFRWPSSSPWSSSRRSIGIAQYPPHLAELVFAKPANPTQKAAARQIQVAPGLRPVLQRFRQGGRSRLCRAVHQLLDEGLFPGVLRLHAAGAGRRGAAGRRLRLHRSDEPWRLDRRQPRFRRRARSACRVCPARRGALDRRCSFRCRRAMLRPAAIPSSVACSPTKRPRQLVRSRVSTSAITTGTSRGTS